MDDDEQYCGGTTSLYCRTDYFHCESTCIPN
ncbi:unnamed protein product, partial [Rotaria sp. Silwood2]